MASVERSGLWQDETRWRAIMATMMAIDSAMPNVRGYNSTRVFDGKRPLTAAAADKHIARFKLCMDKRTSKKNSRVTAQQP